MSKNIIKFFHILIISGFILVSSGCGYKGPPKYVPSTTESNNS